MLAIQNRMKRTFIIPPVSTADNNNPVHDAVTIEPGDTALVDDAHWDKVKEKNEPIAALLSGRHLVVTESGKVKDVHVDELANPASPEAPADLTEKDDRIKLETKTELKEVTLDSDAPAEAKPKK